MRYCVVMIAGALVAGLGFGFWLGQRSTEPPAKGLPPLLRAEPAEDLPLKLPDEPLPPVEIPPKEPSTPEVTERLEEEFHLLPSDRRLATFDIVPPTDSRVPKGEAVVFSPEPGEGEPAEIEVVYRWKPIPPPRLFEWDGRLAADAFIGQDVLDGDRSAYVLGEIGRLVVKGNLEVAPRAGWMQLGSESGIVVGVGARITW